MCVPSYVNNYRLAKRVSRGNTITMYYNALRKRVKKIVSGSYAAYAKRVLLSLKKLNPCLKINGDEQKIHTFNSYTLYFFSSIAIFY